MKAKLKKVAVATGKGVGIFGLGICVGVIIASAVELTTQGIANAKA